jgi:hypothetical protein
LNFTPQLKTSNDGQIIGSVWSSQGSRQGDPLGGLMFCVSLHRSLKATAASSKEIRVCAYFDDVRIAGDSVPVARAAQLFAAEARKDGLTLQPVKSQLLYMRDDPLPQEADQVFSEMSVPIERHAAIVLGAPVGRDTKRMKKMLTDIVKKNDRFFNLLQHKDLPFQEFLLLLSRSGVPRMNYLARCIRPDLFKKFASEFDNNISQCFAKKLRFPNHSSTDLAIKQSKLPVRLGGFGLRHSADICRFAYMGAVALNPSALKGFFGPPSQQFAEAISTTRNQIERQLRIEDRKLLPRPRGSVLDFYISHRNVAIELQKRLTASYESAQYNMMVKDYRVSEFDSLRMQTIREGTWSSAWITAIPFNSRLHLDDEEYRFATFLRLGLPLAEFLPALCACGHRLGQEHTLHALSCCIFKGQLVTARHHEIVEIIWNYLKRIPNTGARKEHTQHVNGHRERPDISGRLKKIMRFIDVTVRDPVLESYEGDLDACEEKANADKRKQYEQSAKQEKAQIVPFLLNIFGGWGNEAVEFVKTVSKANSQKNTGLTNQEFLYSMSTEIAIALQKGNAAAFDACLHVSTSRAEQPASNVKLRGGFVVR